MLDLRILITFAILIIGTFSHTQKSKTSSEIKLEASKRKLLSTCSASHYKFTGAVKKAYLQFARYRALNDLEVDKKKIPEKFIQWVNSESIVRDTVYGMHYRAGDVLQHLYSLRLDLGKEKFHKYIQLALAESVQRAKRGDEADIKFRRPITKIVIPTDPRIRVNTRSTKRKLDINDHIINFLESTTINAPVRKQSRLAELKYDEYGVAIPEPKSKEKEVGKMEKRHLYACDVMESRSLQKKFNAYMKSKGHDVNINCGEKVIHWNSRDMVTGDIGKRLDKVYKMFKAAYEEKGRLPKGRDPAPESGDNIAYIIRNFETKLSMKHKKPYPITAPWPISLMLAAYNQPLREREERWLAYKDKGEFIGYGEYIGKIAQQFSMQSARRLTPYPFYYYTIQMMIKDGGVCGTMANMCVRSLQSIGTPAATAGQPGHCALVSMSYDAKKKIYKCVGGQYATGGHDKTTVAFSWYFGNEQVHTKYSRKKMVYQQSVTWAVNYNFERFLDSIISKAVFELLPDEEKAKYGSRLLKSGLSINPYNMAITDSIIANSSSPIELINFWKTFSEILTEIKAKDGYPKEGLYNETVKNNIFAKMQKLPVPNDKKKIAYINNFIKKLNCNNQDLIVMYAQALKGKSSILSVAKKELREHLKNANLTASGQLKSESIRVSNLISSTAKMIKDNKTKDKWAMSLWEELSGNEKYFDHKYRIATEESIKTLAKLTKATIPSEDDMIEALKKKLYFQLKKSVSKAQRKTAECQILAKKIKSVANLDNDKRWLSLLAKAIKNKEKFNELGEMKTVIDPCSITIDSLLKQS